MNHEDLKGSPLTYKAQLSTAKLLMTVQKKQHGFRRVKEKEWESWTFREGFYSKIYLYAGLMLIFILKVYHVTFALFFLPIELSGPLILISQSR